MFLHFLQLHFRGHFCVHFLHSSVEAQRSLQCYSYIFAVIFVYIFVHPCLPSSVDAQRRLYSTPTLICGCTAVSTVLQLHFRGHFRVHLRTSTPTLIAAHHLPCFQGGKECMATLHSSDRDFTLLYILYILHLRLANIFVIQASIYVLHSTSTFSEHFRDPSIINIFANSAFKKNYSFPLQTENVNFFVRILSSFPSVTFSRSFSVSWIVSVHFAHILINVYVHKSVLVTKTFSQTFMGPQQCNVLWVNILILSSF